MSFNPSLPVNNAAIVAAELRHQFNGLNAGVVPVGGVVAWLKTFPNAPALPASWAECNGQVLADAESPFDGQTLPDLNSTPRFLRGAAASGGTGGADSTSVNTVQANQNRIGTAVNCATNDPIATLPSYYEVVWVMRVK